MKTNDLINFINHIRDKKATLVSKLMALEFEMKVYDTVIKKLEEDLKEIEDNKPC